MSATATDAPHQQLIDLCAADLRSSQARVLETFKFIPDDKLTWSPAPQAKSGLRLMAPLAVSNSGISQLLEGCSLPISNFEELERFVEEQERQITTREQAVEAFNQSCDAYERAIRQVPEGDRDKLLGVGELQAPASFYMRLAGVHHHSHASQIDYLQTCWGDLIPHFPHS